MKKAFITGITGQDGSYLADLLLEKNYEVHAIMRRSSVFTTQRIDRKTGLTLVEIDSRYFRPSEVELLLGDPSKAENELGWKRNISFHQMVSGMVRYDLENDNYGGQELF